MLRTLPFLAVSLLPLLAGGCAINSGDGDASPQVGEGVAATAATQAAPAAPKAPKAAPAKASSAQQAKLEGPAPESLVGSDQASIQKLVGTPTLVRKEKGVEVWQYTDNSCTLIMYFYDDKASGARKLTYMDAVARNGADDASVTPASCLSGQIAAFKTKPVG
jgi:hypothetical protein